MIMVKEEQSDSYKEIEKLEDKMFLTMFKIVAFHHSNKHGGAAAFQEIGRQLFGKEAYDSLYKTFVEMVGEEVS